MDHSPSPWEKEQQKREGGRGERERCGVEGEGTVLLVCPLHAILPLILYAAMKSGVHWLFFSFLLELEMSRVAKDDIIMK